MSNITCDLLLGIFVHPVTTFTLELSNSRSPLYLAAHNFLDNKSAMSIYVLVVLE